MWSVIKAVMSELSADFVEINQAIRPNEKLAMMASVIFVLIMIACFSTLIIAAELMMLFWIVGSWLGKLIPLPDPRWWTFEP